MASIERVTVTLPTLPYDTVSSPSVEGPESTFFPRQLFTHVCSDDM